MLTHTAPRTRHLDSLSPHGFHRVAYYEWGDPANANVVICVHGLSRNGRDFDVLGEALAPTHRTLAIDIPGRGQSQWLADPNDYVFPVYLTALTALIARSGAEHVAWVGTSLGALLGMVMAAQPNTPVRRLVVNDAGPLIEPAAIARIREYVGLDPTFATYAEAEAYIRAISAPFGALTDAQWEHLTRTQRRAASGRPLGLALRPRHRAAVPHQRRAARPVAGLGRHPLPDAGVARRAIGPPVAGDGGADGKPRSQGAHPRSAGRRPRADAAVARPVRARRPVHPRRELTSAAGNARFRLGSAAFGSASVARGHRSHLSGTDCAYRPRAASRFRLQSPRCRRLLPTPPLPWPSPFRCLRSKRIRPTRRKSGRPRWRCGSTTY